MLDRNIKEKLKEELQTPLAIRKRVKFTLDDIRLREFGEVKEESVVKEKKEKRIFGKGIATAAAACVLVVSSITVTATVTKWTPDFLKRFQISENLQGKLEQEGVSYTPLETIEQEGMSISLEQCLTDNEYFYCLFKVTLPDDVAEGQFENITVEGYKTEDYIETDGIYCYQLTEEAGAKNIFYYMISGKHCTLEQQEEGFNIVSQSCVTGEDYKTGHMTFRFENYGVYDEQNQFQPSVSAEWEFQWAEKKVEDKIEYSVNRKVGKGYYARSNSILKTVTISPIVIGLVYELPEGCPEEYYYLARPTEVELKDGTRIELIEIASGFENNFDEENNNYKYAYGLYPVEDPEQITAIYFGENERIELK